MARGPMPEQIGTPALDEGHGELRGEQPELRQDGKRGGHSDGGNDLPENLGAGGQAEAAALGRP